jgi:hypothetical protein
MQHGERQGLVVSDEWLLIGSIAFSGALELFPVELGADHRQCVLTTNR